MIATLIKLTQAPEQFKVGVDISAGVTGLSAMLGVIQGVLGIIATSLTIAWFVYRFYRAFKDKPIKD